MAELLDQPKAESTDDAVAEENDELEDTGGEASEVSEEDGSPEDDEEAAFEAELAKAAQPTEEDAKVETPKAKDAKEPKAAPFTPVKFKSVDGKEVEIKSLEELQKLHAGTLRQDDYTRKTQEVAREKKEFEAVRAIYKEFETRLDQDKNFKALVRTGFADPNFAAFALKAYQQAGHYKPEVVENTYLKQELERSRSVEHEQQRERVLEENRRLVADHMAQIERELGSKPSPEYLQAIYKVYQDGRAKNLLDAFKLHRIESGELEKVIQEKAAKELRKKQNKIMSAQAPRGTASTVVIDDDEEEYERQLMRAVRGQ